MGARTMYENAWRLSDQRLGETHAFTLMYRSNLRRVNEAIVSDYICMYVIQICFLFINCQCEFYCICIIHRMLKMSF